MADGTMKVYLGDVVFIPEIGGNGNWWINGQDTGLKAQGDGVIVKHQGAVLDYDSLPTGLNTLPYNDPSSDMGKGWTSEEDGLTYVWWGSFQSEGEGINLKGEPGGAIATDWTAGTYTKGTMKSHDGKTWKVVTASTSSEPGTGSDWELLGGMDVEALSNFAEMSPNLAQTTGYRLGSYNISGVWSNSTNWLTLEMPVKGDTEYTYGGGRGTPTNHNQIAFFNGNSFISGILGLGTAAVTPDRTFTTPTNCNKIAIIIASGAGATNETDYYNRVFLVEGSTGLEEFKPFGIILKPEKKDLIYLSKDGDDGNSGTTAAKAVASFERVAELLHHRGTLVLGGGEYTDKFDLSAYANVINIPGQVPRFIRGTKVSSATLTAGYTKVLQVAHATTIESVYSLWQHGIPDPNTLIAEDEVHPFHRGKSHRLPSTRLLRVSSIAEVEASPVPCWYQESGIIYFSITPGSNLSDNPVYIPLGNEQFTASETKFVNIQGIEIMYASIRLENLRGTLSNVAVIGGNNGGLFNTNYAMGVTLYGCRAIGGSNDGYNGAGPSSGAGTNEWVDVKFEKCYAAECLDDGESHHNNCIVDWSNGLTEYNGNGNTPATGAHATYTNSIARYNTKFANNGTGFSAQGSASDGGTTTNMYLQNCTSIGHKSNFKGIAGGSSKGYNCISVAVPGITTHHFQNVDKIECSEI